MVPGRDSEPPPECFRSDGRHLVPVKHQDPVGQCIVLLHEPAKSFIVLMPTID
ncbi:MAG: hypothetical protein WC598_11370 [Methanoregula sp.]